MMRWHLCQCLPVDNLRIKFKILEETFNPYKEFELWEKVNKNSANSFFIGRVRPFDQFGNDLKKLEIVHYKGCLLYTSPSPRDRQKSRMPSSA